MSVRSSAAVSSWTSMRAPPRLLPPAFPRAESTTVLPRLSLASRSAPTGAEQPPLALTNFLVMVNLPSLVSAIARMLL